MNSKLLGWKTEKHEIQILSCNRELKADEYWMSAETSWTLSAKFSRLVWTVPTLFESVVMGNVVWSMKHERLLKLEPGRS